MQIASFKIETWFEDDFPLSEYCPVTIVLSDGTERRCTFVTPQGMALAGFPLDDTEDWFRGGIKIAGYIIVNRADPSMIEKTLRHLEAHDCLEVYVDPYGCRYP